MKSDIEAPTESQKFDTVMRKILTLSKDELKKRKKKTAGAPLIAFFAMSGCCEHSTRRKLNIRLTERRYLQ